MTGTTATRRPAAAEGIPVLPASNPRCATAYLLTELRKWEKPYNLTDPTGLAQVSCDDKNGNPNVYLSNTDKIISTATGQTVVDYAATRANNSTSAVELLRALSDPVAAVTGVIENAKQFGQVAISAGSAAKAEGNAMLFSGMLGVNRDSTSALALSQIATGANNIRYGNGLVTAGSAAGITGQAMSLGQMGYALVSGDTKEAIKQAWSYNFGVTGGLMTGAIGGFLAGPPGAILLGGLGGYGFGKAGEIFGEGYYNAFIK